MGILINLVTNNFYFHYFENFYSSVVTFEQIKFRVCLVNIPKYKVKWVKSLDSVIDVEVINRDFEK